MLKEIEKLCLDKNIKLTDQRKVIIDVIEHSKDHPDVEELHVRATKLDDKISIATVYRTVKLLQEEGILQKHDFGDGRARYELSSLEHHDHLINVRTGEIMEFVDEEIEQLQKKIAQKMGYKLVDHRMELYVVPDTE